MYLWGDRKKRTAWEIQRQSEVKSEGTGGYEIFSKLYNKKAMEKGCDVDDRSEQNCREIFQHVVFDVKSLNKNHRGREQEKWTTTLKKIRAKLREDRTNTR